MRSVKEDANGYLIIKCNFQNEKIIEHTYDRQELTEIKYIKFNKIIKAEKQKN